MILLLPTNEISRRCEKSTFSKKRITAHTSRRPPRQNFLL